MKKSESEVEVRAREDRAGESSGGCLGRALIPSLCPQEAAAIIAQRPDNPREFFKQQERVASASAGSCDVPSPFGHRPGSPRSCPHLTLTPQVLATSLFGALLWKGGLAQRPRRRQGCLSHALPLASQGGKACRGWSVWAFG